MFDNDRPQHHAKGKKKKRRPRRAAPRFINGTKALRVVRHPVENPFGLFFAASIRHRAFNTINTGRVTSYSVIWWRYQMIVIFCPHLRQVPTLWSDLHAAHWNYFQFRFSFGIYKALDCYSSWSITARTVSKINTSNVSPFKKNKSLDRNFAIQLLTEAVRMASPEKTKQVPEKEINWQKEEEKCDDRFHIYI